MTKQPSKTLTASEIALLWECYQSDTMTICGLRHLLSNVEDEEIREVLEEILGIMKRNVDELHHIFKTEDYPIPHGFTEQDVIEGAPRLFSDNLYLSYCSSQARLGLTMYATAIGAATRPDIIEYFSKNLRTSEEIHLKTKNLAQEKGIFVYAPEIPKPDKIDFIKKQNFLAGWFADRRALLAIEIANLITNAQQNALGQAFVTGFSQVAESKEIRKYFERGRDISKKHLTIFNTILNEEYLPDGAMITTSEVTDSTVAPFSDKLMLALISSLSTAGISQYGVSMAMSARRDLGVHYARLNAEVTSFSEDGAKLMIENGWMEQPPIAANRKGLAK
jgi:hypothetical protein